ncbi:SDR family NAD(P)-dependent oxidoreductase [Burkholderia stagnalis]|uniref:SDR family NAD(P)-dependent oxidoreductase n=1 Tax=Burkholderia stagnalis TaxID=1503054 RepID=A0ABX9YYC7_9BURK|nr:SDR family NAD(P)-dependent oxidoreductase [Burkholderia stagnalis]RQQ69644.1 SDR family NAD(P)-dependent oxidoreductase [Burkholderia stagnalis]RQQ70696.1 SDR family NAD(P)-dependent oxidoreductase [Burkholderia stagnalis]RQQ82425.1 SDR family NAD(P)-dependent oxidoreductase [Burkholderia stagnalis]RQQ90525.1 SDR family NAD(P)-dependent oxidoreductase [Burkholderia stagnalis]
MSQTLDSSRPPLVGKTAFVTGGARGLGAAICDELARAGANVVVADLDADRAAAVAAQLARHGGRAVGHALEVGDEASVMQAVLVDRGHETEWRIDARRTPHYIVGRLDDAAAIVARVTARCHPEVCG